MKERERMAGSIEGEEDDTMINNNGPWSYIKFDTTIGSFVVELYHKHTPRTCYNIAALADAGYYDNTIFHRIIRDFMIQGQYQENRLFLFLYTLQ